MPYRDDPHCNPDRLALLVRQGDPAALDHITRCYGARLLEAGRKHCRTSDEARDAVQDALVTAGTHLDAYRGDGSMEGWLVRIVATACRRLGRGRKNDASIHDVEAPLFGDDRSPEEQAGRRELAALLDSTLLSLAPEDRMILLLAEVEEQTATEIAERTGLRPGTVRTRLTRLRARLREALAPLLAEASDVL